MAPNQNIPHRFISNGNRDEKNEDDKIYSPANTRIASAHGYSLEFIQQKVGPLVKVWRGYWQPQLGLRETNGQKQMGLQNHSLTSQIGHAFVICGPQCWDRFQNLTTICCWVYSHSVVCFLENVHIFYLSLKPPMPRFQLNMESGSRYMNPHDHGKL